MSWEKALIFYDFKPPDEMRNVIDFLGDTEKLGWKDKAARKVEGVDSITVESSGQHLKVVFRDSRVAARVCNSTSKQKHDLKKEYKFKIRYEKPPRLSQERKTVKAEELDPTVVEVSQAEKKFSFCRKKETSSLAQQSFSSKAKTTNAFWTPHCTSTLRSQACRIRHGRSFP
eukprot:m.99336 g.99336  ORF g.99336 m.99336 type:complete len:172 (+) comp37065_c0_seq1:2312-2827(+)